MVEADITIIIISFRRRGILEQTLSALREHLREIAGTRVQVLVIDPDPAPLNVDRVEHVIPPEHSRGNFAALRNVGLDRAAGRIVVFIDDDCIPMAGWLERLTAPLERGDAVGVAGAVLYQDTGAVGRAVALLGFPAGSMARILETGNTVTPTHLVSTCNGAFMRRSGDEKWRFDERLRHGGEDQAFFEQMAARHPVLFVPGAVVRHLQRDRIGQMGSWFMRRGRGEYQRRRHAAGKGWIAAAVGPLRAWMLPRWVLVLLPPILWGRPGLLLSLLIAVGWYLWQLARLKIRHRRPPGGLPEHIEALRRLMITPAPLLVAPLVKAIMDHAFEIGRWRGALQEWRGRS